MANLYNIPFGTILCGGAMHRCNIDTMIHAIKLFKCLSANLFSLAITSSESMPKYVCVQCRINS